MLSLENMFGDEPESDEIQEPPADFMYTHGGMVMIADIKTLEDLEWQESFHVSEKQFNWIKDMLLKKELPDYVERSCQWQRLPSISRAEASQWIDQLKPLPWNKKNIGSRQQGVDPPSIEALPRGRYAIENDKGELCFYNVWRGDRRPDYVKVYLQHGPDDSEVPFIAAMSICHKIVKAGPMVCAQRYGKEIGSCYRCGLRLTNRLSRELGIGPVCGGRDFGDQFKVIKEEATTRLREQGLDPSETVED
jgi:uncharacterized protein DUF6011